MPPARRGADAIAPADLERRLEREAPGPLYLLDGPEAILRDRALRALRARVVDPDFEAFNYRRLEPAGLDAAALAEEMRVAPMGGGRRLVVLGPAESLLKDHLKHLGAYAESPSPATCLVLILEESKEAVRKAFASAVVVDCGSPYEDRIPEHLLAEARTLGVRLERDAAAELARLCGRDLSRAVAELRKAAGRAGPGGAVDAGMVRELAGGGEAGDVFRISACLARGDAPGAVLAARRYLETEDRGEVRVLYEMGTFLRRLLTARGHLDAGAPARDAARSAGVFWKEIDAFAGELPKWDERRIAGAFRRLIEADRAVKRGADDGGAVIESLLWGVFAEAGRRPAGRARA